MFEKNSAVPLHVQLKELVRARVLDGSLMANSQLPSERELCEQYDISRTTVRKAMAELLSEGLIYTTVGKGTYVAPSPIKEEILPLSSFTEDMARRGWKASGAVLKAEVQNANDEQAERLHLPRGAEVVVLHRLRLADGLPIAIQHSWFPHHLCPDLLKTDLTDHSLFLILRDQYHLRLDHADTEIHAALADSQDCRLLKLVPPAAVLVSEQTTYLDTGALIEYTHSHFRADQYSLFSRFGR
jgi:GntR family transcriptional regulator